MRTNRFDGACSGCGRKVPAETGFLLGRPGAWTVRCRACPPRPPAREAHDGWHRRPLAALDFETTGTDVTADRIVSVGLLAPTGESFYTLTNPGVPIPADAQAIHAISDADVAGAPDTAAIVTWLWDVLARCAAAAAPLVVFNAAFDLNLLHAEAVRHGVLAPDLTGLTVIDPYVLDWGIHRGQYGPRTLTDTCAFYEVRLENAHSAQADAAAARALAVEFGARHPQLAAMDPGQLMAEQRRWHTDKVDDWNAYAARAGRPLDAHPDWPWAAPAIHVAAG